ncbi:hypothetical protein HPB47_001749 [Ixodes persulcatus]|uniref:Uncharacterized protein n=1 Tax=Ixodes persulcatus TaxID=34615 RepID=A0AC60PPN9_IXOPE|nr:hypothetical protein HPB47_001749 [Ixodes persulcatus]
MKPSVQQQAEEWRHESRINKYLNELQEKARKEDFVEDIRSSHKEGKWHVVGLKKRQKKLMREYKATTTKGGRRTYVIIIRVRDTDLRRMTYDSLANAIYRAAKVQTAIACNEDEININAKSNTVSIHTDSMEREGFYNKIQQLSFQDKAVEAKGHSTTPDNLGRVVVSKLIAPERETKDEEILEHFIQHNPHFKIVDGRRMGRSTSVLVTLGSFDPPGYLKFMGGRHRFHDYMEKKQACTKCWTLGHRPDTCISSIEERCPNCGEFHEHPPKRLGVRTEYTCTPKCPICGKQHYTGSRDRTERFKPHRIWQESRTEKRIPLPKKEDFVSLTPGKVDEPKSVQGKSYMQALQKTQAPPQGQDTRTGNETLEKALKQLREELKQPREERQDERVAFEKQLRAERAKYEKESTSSEGNPVV